jgi:glycine cleavage system H protein
VDEQVWRGCVIPRDLLYDTDLHVWVRIEGDEAVIGMTDVAQTMGGRIVQVTWKPPGRVVGRGRSVAIVESAKWVGPFPTPLTGELVAVNEEGFRRDVAVANRDPYGAGWFARIRPTRLREERGHLVDGSTAFDRYRAFIEEEGINCFRCED